MATRRYGVKRSWIESGSLKEFWDERVRIYLEGPVWVCGYCSVPLLPANPFVQSQLQQTKDRAISDEWSQTLFRCLMGQTYAKTRPLWINTEQIASAFCSERLEWFLAFGDETLYDRQSFSSFCKLLLASSCWNADASLTQNRFRYRTICGQIRWCLDAVRLQSTPMQPQLSLRT